MDKKIDLTRKTSWYMKSYITVDNERLITAFYVVGTLEITVDFAFVLTPNSIEWG